MSNFYDKYILMQTTMLTIVSAVVCAAYSETLISICKHIMPFLVFVSSNITTILTMASGVDLLISDTNVMFISDPF